MSINGYANFMGINHSRFSNAGKLKQEAETITDGAVSHSTTIEKDVFFAYQGAGDLKPRGLRIDEGLDSISLTKQSETTNIVLHYSESLLDILNSDEKISFEIGSKSIEIKGYENYGNNKVYLILNLEKVTFGRST